MVESLLSPVIEKLIDLLIKEAKSLKGVHKQVKSLQKELEIIEPLLHDAEAKSSRGELSNPTKVWIRQLKEEADRIDDIIDEYTYQAEQRRHKEAGFAWSLHKASQYAKSFKTRRDLASEIQDVKESLREIKERGLSYGLRPFEQGGSSCGEGTSLVDPRIGSLFIDDDELVGIESVSNELVRSLVEGRPERTVISLVGEGGIGKTTLARKVYNDVVEKGSFDHAVWVTISQSYDIDKILKMLMTRICPPVREIVAIEEAFTLLRRSLQAKRYVIVFDDVWQTDLWSVVKHALPNGNNGSRILITTRKSTVIESFKSPSTEMIVTKLRTWSREQAWELFCKKAFPSSDCPAELEELSREILKKCQGVPLAVVAVAGLLSRKEKSKVEWKTVLKSLDYEFEENNGLGNVSKILLLSYHDLPYHLKPCFLYFGIYPEDYSVMDGRLLKIWIAEGFIKPKKNMTLEQIADEYLTDLISRNLVSSELLYGFGRWCKVHDLIRELILSKASAIGFCQIFNKSKSSCKEESRRLIIYDTTENVFKAASDSKIRSVVLFNVNKLSASYVVGVFESCKLLKVVDFDEAPLDYLPKEVGNLLHLKYLNLSGTKVKTLPKSIGKLQNLQSLNVRCTLVRELPLEINKLRKLRHLSADSFDEVAEYSVNSYIGVKMHKGIEMLEDLQTLHTVEAHSGRVDFVRELQKHSKLKCLGISKVTAQMCEALGESIEEINNLEHLFLMSISEEEVLDLKCSSSTPILLRSIRLICRLRKLPTWVSELQYLQGLELNFSRLVDEPLKRLKDLPNLSYLRLHKAYEGEELRFEKGGFPKLKLLHLEYMEGLNAVKIESGSLPLLERLKFGGFPLMKEMPCDLQHLSNLKFLWILDMPREFVKALQPKGGYEFCKIQHISSVIFGYYTGKGCSYNWLKLGSSELLQHLEKQQQCK